MSASETKTDVPVSLQNMLARYTELEHTKRKLENELEATAFEMKAIEPTLIDAMLDIDMTSTRVADLTVYINTTQFVSKRSGVSTSALCDVLRESGFGDLIVTESYNAQSLKSRMLEMKKDGREIPPALESLLSIGENLSLRARK